MARVAGTPGATAGAVRRAQLGRDTASWLRAFPGVGAGAACLSWALGGMSSHPVAVAATVLAALGGAALGVSAIATWLGRIAAERLELVLWWADAVAAGGAGGLAGLALPQGGHVAWRVGVAALGILTAAMGVALRAGEMRSEWARIGAGASGERRVARALDSLPDEYVVVHDAVVRDGGSRREVDHVVLGPTGIWVLETKRWGGTIIPGPDTWTRETPRGTVRHPSPAAQLERARRAVAAALGARPEAVRAVLVLVGGTVMGDPGVPVCRPSDLADTITLSGGSWPLAIPPEEAARLLAT